MVVVVVVVVCHGTAKEAALLNCHEFLDNSGQVSNLFAGLPSFRDVFCQTTWINLQQSNIAGCRYLNEISDKSTNGGFSIAMSKLESNYCLQPLLLDTPYKSPPFVVRV